MRKILIFLTVLIAFTAPSMGMEFNTYMKFSTGMWWMKSYRFYDDAKFDSLYNRAEYPFPVNTGDFLTGGTLGFKSKGDKLETVVEVGIKKNVYDAWMTMDNKDHSYRKFNYAPYLKKWYANIFFNDYFSVLAGQDFSPSCFFPSDQAFLGGTCFLNIGCLYTGRHPMIKLNFHHPDQIWEIQGAVIKQDTANIRYPGMYNEDYGRLDTVRYYADVRVPKLKCSFTLNIEQGIFSIYDRIVTGYQTNDQTATNEKWFEGGVEKQEVKSYVIGNDFRVKIGPVSLAFDAFYGQNLMQYGAYIGDAFGWWFTDTYMLVFTPKTSPDTLDNGAFLNSRVFEWSAIASYKITDWFKLEGGFGRVVGYHDFEGYAEQWNPTIAWYFQPAFKLYDKLELKPEIGQYNYGPNDGFGKYLYWGFDTYIEF